MILPCVNGEPTSGAAPSNGIIVLPLATPNCVVKFPEEPLLAIVNVACPILAPV